MVDKLITFMIVPTNTFVQSELKRVLSALEAEPLLVPTHASADERKRRPFELAKAVEQVADQTLGYLSLWRTKAPKYSEGHLTAYQQSHNKLGMDFAPGLKDSQLPNLFDAWTRLAEELHPEFGFVHMLWKLGTPESIQYNYGCRLKVHEFRNTGILTVHARTWFGPDLVKMIGRERLLGLRHTKETEWGAVQLDLVENPWLADFEALFPRQREVGEALDEWGMLGDYSDVLELKPGRNWVPPLWKGMR